MTGRNRSNRDIQGGLSWRGKDAEGKKMEDLSDKDIVLYALYLLGGWRKRVHTEDVALKCYQLVPSKFSWVKYPDYPDVAPARFALEAAKKPKYGALVQGESERKRTVKEPMVGGWMLTANGVRWIEANKPKIEQHLGKHSVKGERLLGERRVRKLIESAAFKKFREYGEEADISHAEFAASLISTVNTQAKVLEDRLAQLYSTAEKLQREDVKDYVNFCRKKFETLLNMR